MLPSDSPPRDSVLADGAPGHDFARIDLAQFDLAHFVAAQDPVWPAVIAELAAGVKRSHWMWFVFPQIAGLGHSATARRFALPSLDAARAYLAHPVLGPRLAETTALVLAQAGTDAAPVFGPVDAVKYRSSMTLFAVAAPERTQFRGALDAFAAGVPDPLTLARIGR